MNKRTFTFFLISALFSFEACASSNNKSGNNASSIKAKAEDLEYKGWIRFGWLTGDLEPKPLLQMRLPPFMEQEYYCEYYKKIDGAHYCGTSDSMLSIRGSFKDGDREVRIDLSGTGYSFGKPLPPPSTSFKERKMAQWKKSLIEYREIELDGHPAYYFEIADGWQSERSEHRYRLVTYYNYKNMHGDIDIAVSAKSQNGKFEGLPNKEWSPKLREYLDKMIKSVRFMRKVGE